MFLGGPNGRGTSNDPQIDVCAALVEEGKKHGMQAFFRTRAEQLVREKDGRVTAVLARKKDGSYVKYVATKAVVLATGDYAADKEMVAKFCPNAEGLQSIYAPPGSNSGDGHKMALWAGASLQKGVPHAPMIFAVPSNFDVRLFDLLDKQGMLDAFDSMLAIGGTVWNVVVNKHSERFIVDYTNGAHMAAQIALQPGEEAYSIWDAGYIPQLNVSAYEGGPKPTAEVIRKGLDLLADAGINYVKSDTIEGLAEKLKLPPADLKRTVERYNGFCDAGVDEDFHKPKKFLFPMRTPPFYGLAVGRGFLITVGGLLTDNNLRVLDKKGQAIPGLYAVGTMTGDFFSNCYTTSMPGFNLGRCVTFGYLTGRRLAKESA
jgi:succinate dehydrogenase/fumarate reductase flavoprotein subunit